MSYTEPTPAQFRKQVDSVSHLHYELARDFRIAVSTIRRWCEGGSLPGPNVRAAVLRWIEGQK